MLKYGTSPWRRSSVHYLKCGSRDSVVGIQARYGVSGPGLEFQSRQEIFSSPKPPLELTRPPPMGTGAFPWGKAAGARRYHPPPSAVEVKETVDLYLYPYVPSWNVTRRIPSFILQCRTTYKHYECLCQLKDRNVSSLPTTLHVLSAYVVTKTCNRCLQPHYSKVAPSPINELRTNYRFKQY